jgi:hypothetical protein
MFSLITNFVFSTLMESSNWVTECV